MLLPDRELALTYALVLGPYPMLKQRLDKLPGPPAAPGGQTGGVVNAPRCWSATGCCWWCSLLPGLWEEFAAGGLALTHGHAGGGQCGL